jgi:tyrosine-protein phosphatase SIW14
MSSDSFLAPENFAIVENGVYRSAFPRTKNCLFLQKLGLKAVVSLVPEEYPKSMVDFYDANGITLISHGLDGNKWPFKAIDLAQLNNVLIDILNPENRPLLIHCNKGKHRTGTVVGSIRKLRGWSYSSIFQEYILYATPKVRCEDQMMIEYFSFAPPPLSPPTPEPVPMVVDEDGNLKKKKDLTESAKLAKQEKKEKKAVKKDKEIEEREKVIHEEKEKLIALVVEEGMDQMKEKIVQGMN